MRDGYRRPTPPIVNTDDLIAFIQEDNRDFMRFAYTNLGGVLDNDKTVD